MCVWSYLHAPAAVRCSQHGDPGSLPGLPVKGTMETIGGENVKKRTKTTVRRMLYLLKRGAIFPLDGKGMYINPPTIHRIEGKIEEKLI